MSAMLNFARRAGLAVAGVGLVNEFFLYDGTTLHDFLKLLPFH